MQMALVFPTFIFNISSASCRKPTRLCLNLHLEAFGNVVAEFRGAARDGHDFFLHGTGFGIGGCFSEHGRFWEELFLHSSLEIDLMECLLETLVPDCMLQTMSHLHQWSVSATLVERALPFRMLCHLV